MTQTNNDEKRIQIVVHSHECNQLSTQNGVQSEDDYSLRIQPTKTWKKMIGGLLLIAIAAFGFVNYYGSDQAVNTNGVIMDEIANTNGRQLETDNAKTINFISQHIEELGKEKCKISWNVGDQWNFERLPELQSGKYQVIITVPKDMFHADELRSLDLLREHFGADAMDQFVLQNKEFIDEVFGEGEWESMITGYPNLKSLDEIKGMITTHVTQTDGVSSIEINLERQSITIGEDEYYLVQCEDVEKALEWLHKGGNVGKKVVKVVVQMKKND